MKLLYITSLSGRRVNGFMKSAIVAARNLDIEFVMACNTCDADLEAYKTDCDQYGIELRHIDFQRNPLHPKNYLAYRQLLKLIQQGKFDVIHCNTPIGGVLGRICAKQLGVRTVIYQAHGFHFYKGAPIVNWVVYYPIEKCLSKLTDVLITITSEDYALAQSFYAKRNEYVHGVGIETNRFCERPHGERNQELRKRLGIPSDAKVLLSVGELNRNKNHRIVIDAMTSLGDNVFYVICGDGELKEYYKSYIRTHKLEERVILAGFRTDVADYYRMADLFVFPSLREGIPGAIMEAIATGVPVIASDIRGISDIIQDSQYRFNPRKVDSLVSLINEKLQINTVDCQTNNIRNLEKYSFENVVKELEQVYRSIDL